MQDGEGAALPLPAGPYDVPLVLRDRILDTTPDGSLTGRLRHKVQIGLIVCFGPFTLVNGTIWPYLPVEARQYRLRLLNGSNSRFYRLVLLDEQGKPALDKITQIGTDGGLLGRPVAVPQDGLLLAPAERADLIVDFRARPGQRLTLVNTASAPFDNSPATQPPGIPDPDNRLPHPEVMEFRVSSQPVDDPFVIHAALSSSYRRLEHDRLPPAHQHRFVAMVEYPAGMLTFHELAEVSDGDAAAGEALMVIA